jgi:hypothetical protein
MKHLLTLCWLSALGLVAATAQAGDCGCAAAADCCQSCDPCCNQCCGKRCELQIGKKKVKVTCFDCECEDICLPGPSRKLCTHRENVCSECGSDCGCSCSRHGKADFVWSEWCPTKCAKVTNIKKLVKREVEKEVPDYKWVVVDCCAEACAEATDKVEAGSGEDKPPMPPVPTPASTTTQRRPITRPVPTGARVGDSFPLTEAEIKQVESQIQQASHTAPAVRVATRPVTATRVQVAPVKAIRETTPPATSKVPWALFGN